MIETNKYIEVDNKIIGPGRPTYIIAEIGINHNGDEKIAFELVDAAIEARVDAVKFQKRSLPDIYTEDVLKHPEKYEQTFQYMIPLLKKVELEKDSFRKLKAYCDQKGMSFLCTPFDRVSGDFLNSLGVPAFKIASADLTNNDLLGHIAGFGKPMIMSTGMSTWKEIEQAADLMRERQAKFAFLHCRSVYPVWPREVNLGMINQLKKYGVPVGYSGHEIGITVALVAASMGAEIIEKHITLDRNQEGPDHKASLEPHEFKRLVRDIKVADQALGKNKRYLLRGEVLNRELFAKSLVANEDISKGQEIVERMVGVKSPAKGLPPYEKKNLLGRKAVRDVKKGDCFVEEDVGNRRAQTFKDVFKSDWGLIARFTDYRKMLAYSPKVIEFHLAENDFGIPFDPVEHINCKLVVHCPEYMGENLMDLCSFDETIRGQSVDLVVKTAELVKNISGYFKGRPKIIVHPGAMSLNEKLDKRLLEERLTHSIKEIQEKLGCSTIEILLENLPPYPWYFGGQWKGNYFMDCMEIAQFAKDQNVGICFDLSHAALYCNAKGKDLSEQIKVVLPFTQHLHLADGYGLDGEGVQFGEGDIALDRVMPLFSNYSGSWVPEVWRGHLQNGKGFIDALEYLGRYML